MSSSIANFTTAEQEILAEYRKNGTPFLFQTRPMHSTISVKCLFVDRMANAIHLVVPKDQRIQCFDYAIGDQRPDGFGGTMPATYADTNLTTPRRTNGTEDFVINGIRASVRGVRVRYPNAPDGVSNSIVVAAYAGRKTMLDIGAVVRPPQLDSPLRLEDALGGLLRKFLSFSFLWDGEQTTRVGLASNAPDFQAASLLTSAGLPTETNQYNLPEGWCWRRTGSKHDTELNLVALTEDDIVYVVNTPTWTGDDGPSEPQEGAVEVTVELCGFSLKYPSKN